MTRRTWTLVVVLGLAGQLAWTVENMYLNLFVYETITDDPTVTAVLVAASAVTATVAAMLVGAASDRAGTRRRFIALGYVAWGLTTAGFGLLSADAVATWAPVGDAVAFAVVAVVLLDCLMSFLGAGANDAAYQAWITDITTPDVRGRVEGVVAPLALVSMLIVFGGFDWLAQRDDWRAFFGSIGLLVAAAGVLAWFTVRDAPALRRSPEGYLGSVLHGLRPSAVRANPVLYLALVMWAVVGTATQVFLPFLIIYLQKTLRIDGYALVLAVVLGGATVVAVLGGRLIDRMGKLRAVFPAVAIYAAGLLLMFPARGMAAVILAGLVTIGGMMLVLAAVGSFVRDHTPRDRAGQVQGLRMVFAVLVPMVVGPFLGAAVIHGSGRTYTDLGVERQVPTPGIFLAAAAVLAVVLPLALLARRLELRAAALEPVS
ncbi:MFS transporter [Nocardioides ferulae]|uniref:MFS transporter n=1 Tax=Nocardioides ferulae TaxID=2340821 RepID=UPI00197FF335|nr:MFS transporter [Nocardioides ferulae]